MSYMILDRWDYNKLTVLIRGEDGEFRPALPVEIISEITRLRTKAERLETEAHALSEQIIVLRTLLSATVELAEYWIEQGREPNMSKERYDLWLATGHHSGTLRRARAALTGKEAGQ